MSDREIIPRSSPVEVIPANNFNSLAQQIGDAVNIMFGRAGITLGPKRAIEYEDLDEEGKKIIDATLSSLDEELTQKAKIMLAAEIKDRLARYGDMAMLSKMLKKKKHVYLKRKIGCLYLQFGTGEAEDPIDEFLIAST
jgi:hypothetical protein